MAELDLIIAGNRFGGWEQVSVRRTMEAAAGTFELEVNRTDPFPIYAGARCELYSGPWKLLAGIIDTVEYAFDESSRSVSVKGRDLAGQLVDCSAMNDPGEWNGIRLVDLVTALANPFGVAVARNPEEPFPEPFDVFKLEPGETAYDAIGRACKLRGRMAYSENTAVLRISQASALRLGDAAIVEGENLKEANATDSFLQRFSEYHVRGQSPTTDDLEDEEAFGSDGLAGDESVELYRPRLILPEGAVTADEAQERAEAEAALGLALSMSVTAVVQGWGFNEAGEPWQVNRLVPVRAPSLHVDALLLIASVEFESGPRGTTTKLRLVDPRAYGTPKKLEKKDDPFGGDRTPDGLLRNTTITAEPPSFFDPVF